MSTEPQILAHIEEAATPCDAQPELYKKRLDSWHEKGRQLSTQGNSTVWETADWLLEATSFGPRERWCYKEAAAILSLSVGTCRNYASVAKAFPPERRVTSEVTFGHHRVVATLPEAEQERLLGAAATNRWTVGKLRSEVRKVNGVPRKQYLSSPEQRTTKWWKALGRLTSACQIAEALVVMQELLEPQKRPEVAGYLRLVGARVIALAEQIETLPTPKAIPEEPAPKPAPTIQMEVTGDLAVTSRGNNGIQ